VPTLRAVALTAPLENFAFNGVLFTIILALRQHGTSAAVIGLVQAAIMAGGLLGATLAPRLQGRVRLSTLATAIGLAGALLFGAAPCSSRHRWWRRRSPWPCCSRRPRTPRCSP
jgi:MFS family permease